MGTGVFFMSFLDNSGDIILDAVLTDTGRFRLAKGDGSFKITKFAFADDEINYNNYDKNNASGSAYYDLDILQTPVLEAFTNNTSTMKSKLISVPTTNLLFLPVTKINDIWSSSTKPSVASGFSGSFLVAVDADTRTTFSGEQGVLNGVDPEPGNNYVRVDQGLDTTEISFAQSLDPNLLENQYILQLDSRLGSVANVEGNPTNPSFIDDDNIAHYYISKGDGNYVADINCTDKNGDCNNKMAISGPRGTYLQFMMNASIELNSSTYLFTKLGSTTTYSNGGLSQAIYFIDTMIRITGATTGYSIDIPVRFIKNQ